MTKIPSKGLMTFHTTALTIKLQNGFGGDKL